MIGRTNAGGGGSLGKSTLIVQTETGSTVTVTKGSETRGTVEKYGVWAFSGLAAGEWTVKAVKSGKTATKTVTMDGTKSVMVALAFNVIPAFTYTGDYETVDDDDNPITTTTGNWKIRFLTSGTLKFAELQGAENGIDVFAVGGGGAGNTRTSSGRYYGGGGGAGYTGTKKAVTVAVNTPYEIVVGSGGAAASGLTFNRGGNTTAFGLTAGGGSDGHQSTSDSAGGNGGSGGASGYLATTSTVSNPGGTDGGSGDGGADAAHPSHGLGQGTTTREFGESTGKLYATGGDGGAASPKSGAANTGNGGDGARGATSGAGGSGIVIIRNHREGAA